MGLKGKNAQNISLEPRAGYTEQQPKGTGRERVWAMIDFLETLTVTSGMHVGRKFIIRKWQEQNIIQPVYGKIKNNKRVVRTVLITMGRKNGKTALTAGLGLAHLAGPEAEPRGKVYSAAADRAHASLIFDEMRAMVQQHQKLRDRIVIRDFNKEMEDSVTGSKFQAISADANTKHGFNGSCIIYDELAQAPD